MNLINREAGDKTKGFRLQRLRALSLMLSKIKENPKVYCYSGTEYLEDVYLKENSIDGSKEYLEEDKNYGSSSFSMNTTVIRNTFVSFIDIWISKRMSKNLSFVFYTTTSIAQEKKTKLAIELDIKFPVALDENGNEETKPILRFLESKELETKDLIDSVKKYILYEYEKQYSNTEEQGYLDLIKNWNDYEWKSFLSAISWQFEEKGNQDVELDLVKEIKDCPYYNISKHNGIEKEIINALIGLLDEKHSLQDFTERFIHSSEIQLLFLKINNASNNYTMEKNEDPVFSIWESLPPPEDKRTISQKIRTICPTLTKNAEGNIAIKVATARCEEKEIGDSKAFLAMKYRIYIQCKEELSAILSKFEENTISENEIAKWFKILKDKAYHCIQDNDKAFHYPYNTQQIIHNVIYELFDSCFLSFDKTIDI